LEEEEAVAIMLDKMEVMVGQVAAALEIQKHQLIQEGLVLLDKEIMVERQQLLLQEPQVQVAVEELAAQEELEAVDLVEQEEQEYHTLVQPMPLEVLEVQQVEGQQVMSLLQLIILEMVGMEQAHQGLTFKDKLAVQE
jgi:acetyl/propionyl-CoA carboxylase alpha subunit